MSGKINIIFYSRNCYTCQNLIKVLQNENLLSFFKLYCVDNRLNQLPVHIKMVPTMIVTNVNRPLVGKETFEWIKKVKFIRQQVVNQKIRQNNFAKMNKDPIGFNNQEMIGKSDNYAYVHVDVPFVHSYHGVNDEKNNAIFTASEFTKPIGKNEQNKMIKNLEQKRSHQDQTYKDIQKEQQLLSVMEAEQNNGRL